MDHVRKMLSCPAYIKHTLEFVGVGMFLGGLNVFGHRLLERPVVPEGLQDRKFLLQNGLLFDLSNELVTKIRLNGISKAQENNIVVMTELLDVLAGFELLVDRQIFIPWETNYRIQYVLSELDKCLLIVLDQKFQLPVIGKDICDVIDKLQEACLSIKHNVELQMQIQDIR
jgi:hypothetical protein